MTHCTLDTLQVSSFPLATMFGMCTAFLGVAALCQRRLHGLVVAAEKEHALADSNSLLLAGVKGGAGLPARRPAAFDDL